MQLQKAGKQGSMHHAIGKQIIFHYLYQINLLS